MTQDLKNSKLPLPIKPPKSASEAFSSYSLFDQSSINILFNKDRKYSFDGITVDKQQQQHFWRRASLPKSNDICSKCHTKTITNYSTQPCGHRVCQNCTLSLEVPISIYASCSICVSLQEATFSLTPPPLSYQVDDSLLQQPLFPFTLKANKAPSISSKFDFISLLDQGHYCAKVSNIPWDVSQNDIRAMFINQNIPELSVHVQSIHIMMDRMTGKTLSDCFVEFKTDNDLKQAIEMGNQKHIKGRIVSVFRYKYEDMMKWIFPKWSGHFMENTAVPTKQNHHNNPFITKEEMNSLLVICKNYKLHFSRKCAERPFENIVSIVEKYPWHQPELVPIIQRDRVYELLKLAIDSLKIHLAKSTVHIEPTLLQRMARAGESCPGFTEKQRLTLLYNANIAPSASIHDTRSYYEYYHNEVVLSDDGSSMASSCSTSSSTFSLSFAEVAVQTNITADH